MHILEQVKRWLGEFVEIALLLIALGVAIEILFGTNALFFGQVVGNLTTLIQGLGDNGLVGLIALGIIVWLFRRRVAPQQ
jgi:hypothetical protein